MCMALRSGDTFARTGICGMLEWGQFKTRTHLHGYRNTMHPLDLHVRTETKLACPACRGAWPLFPGHGAPPCSVPKRPAGSIPPLALPC